jgi:hypothetical protein
MGPRKPREREDQVFSSSPGLVTRRIASGHVPNATVYPEAVKFSSRVETNGAPQGPLEKSQGFLSTLDVS